MAVAQQNRDVPGCLIGHREVGFAVTVEVADRHGPAIEACGVTNAGRERAIALVQKHRDLAVAIMILSQADVRDGEARSAVAIDGAHGNATTTTHCSTVNGHET